MGESGMVKGRMGILGGLTSSSTQSMSGPKPDKLCCQATADKTRLGYTIGAGSCFEGLTSNPLPAYAYVYDTP